MFCSKTRKPYFTTFHLSVFFSLILSMLSFYGLLSSSTFLFALCNIILLKLPPCFHLLAWLTHYSASFLSPMTVLLFFHPVLSYVKAKIPPLQLQNFQGVRVLPAILSSATKVKALTLIQMIKKKKGNWKKKKKKAWSQVIVKIWCSSYVLHDSDPCLIYSFLSYVHVNAKCYTTQMEHMASILDFLYWG